MKRNAFVRIVLYSVLAVALVSILISELWKDGFLIQPHGESPVDQEASIEAGNCQQIEINWAAGSVVIKREDVSRIVFRETADRDIKQPMTYRFSDDTLEINHSAQRFGFSTSQEKNLCIIVPLHWNAESIQINGADLTIDIIDLDLRELDMNGTDCNVNFRGSVEDVSIDGAAANAVLNCVNHVSKIEIAGVGSKLDLTLPMGCGFLLEIDGLSCNFQSDLSVTTQGNTYAYGDEHCKIDVDGIGCEVAIQENPVWPIEQQKT